MPTIISTSSRSPWRISAVFGSMPSLVASDYSVSRDDGGGTATTVSSVWLLPGVGFAVELALSEPLLRDVVYRLAVSGGASVLVAYREQETTAANAEQQDDPEADTYGVDWDWLGELGPDGDLVEVKGLQCVKDDLVAIARTSPGELFTRPEEGAGLPDDVNGPGGPDQALQALGRIKRQWARDDRVKPNGIQLEATTTAEGLLMITGSVETVALPEPLLIQITPKG